MKSKFQFNCNGWYVRNNLFGIRGGSLLNKTVTKKTISIGEFIERCMTSSDKKVSLSKEDKEEYSYECISSVQLINASGWGVLINERALEEFGFYKDGKLVNDITRFVKWFQDYMNYFGSLYRIVGFIDKGSGELKEMFIGLHETITMIRRAPDMGFRFMPDGSVWMGCVFKRQELTGVYINFSNTGEIHSGFFVDGLLKQKLTLQEIIAVYFSCHDETYHEYLPFAPLSVVRGKLQGFYEFGGSFKNKAIEEIQSGKNYFL